MAVETAAGTVGAAAVESRAAASPPWLADRRRAAWDAYTSLPMPSSARDEDWRRTDISRLHPEEFRVGGGEAAEAVAEVVRTRRDGVSPGAALLLDTGGLSGGVGARAEGEGAERLAAEGVTVCSLEEAGGRHPELVQRALTPVGVGDSKLIALWNALWGAGCFVHVPRFVEASVPVWAAHVAGADGGAVFPSTVALLEEGASLTLVDVYASPTGEGSLLSDAVVALSLGRGARLDYGCLQQWGPRAWHMSTHRSVIGADAALRSFWATLGSRLQKAYWDAFLDGQGADATLTGVCFGDGSQHLDHQSLQAHRAPRTRSDLLLKVAVRDRARSVYSGLIDVEEAAQQTDAYVQNRNLILGDGAKADSVPRLEIKANDVRCGHGATAGHVDPEQRFYLQSRGLPAEEAQRVIVRGFMADAIDRIPDAGFRELVAGILDEEIAGHGQAGIDTSEAR